VSERERVDGCWCSLACCVHAEAIDHGRVAVGSDDRVGIELAVGVKDGAREELEVDLVHDAGAGRHDRQAAEGVGTPLEEHEALLVALELEVEVVLERAGIAGVVDLHAVVDHEVDWHRRVDAVRVAAEALDGIAHRGEIDHARHAGEVLQDDARRLERHLGLELAALLYVPSTAHAQALRCQSASESAYLARRGNDAYSS